MTKKIVITSAGKGIINQLKVETTIDLSSAVPDISLLPDVQLAMAQSADVSDLNHSPSLPIIPFLQQILQENWPYPSDNHLIINGAYSGLSLLCKKLLTDGSTIAVESPFPISQLDLLKLFKVKTLLVRSDEYGPVLSDLHQALACKPVFFIYQPKVNFPCGHSVSQQRMTAMAELFRHSNTFIMELDLMADLVKQPVLSLGGYYPEQTIYNRAYMFSYGIDLNLAVLSAPKKLISAIIDYRNYNAGWTSRLLQQALANLITNHQSQMQLTHAADIYRQRQMRLLTALSKRGLTIGENRGFNLWLKVNNERCALISLAAKGIQVMGGSYLADNSGQAHICVATSLLQTEQIDYIADSLASVVIV